MISVFEEGGRERSRWLVERLTMGPHHYICLCTYRGKDGGRGIGGHGIRPGEAPSEDGDGEDGGSEGEARASQAKKHGSGLHCLIFCEESSPLFRELLKLQVGVNSKFRLSKK